MNESNGNLAKEVTSLDDIFAFIILCLILVFGIVGGNLFVVIAILKRRRLPKSNYYYLVLHLTICDFSLLICSIPRTYYTSWFSSTNSSFSSTVCNIWRHVEITKLLFLMASTNIMVLIAILRYRAGVYPFHATLSRRKLTLVTFSVCVFGVRFVISHLVLLAHYSTRRCFEVWPDSDLTETYLSIISIIHYSTFKISRNLIQQYMKTGN